MSASSRSVLLLSTYELGRQPFGLASPAAWLTAAGHRVVCSDLALDRLSPAQVREADVIGIYLPMHTATRLALSLIPRLRALNPEAAICAFGLYAPLAEEALRPLGVTAFFGGEFEAALSAFVDGSSAPGGVSLDRLRFLPPDRSTLPVLHRYPKLRIPDGSTRVVGATEASRGCKHRCRHCPVVPVYNGAFRIVQPEIVLEDIRRQVTGLGAQHISFGDPDFFNGPTHARRLVEAFHREFPNVSYDVTIKIEHLLQRSDLLPLLGATGCAFVISAVESLDDVVLAKLDKGHTRADFVRAVELLQATGVPLAPTFIPFTPWTTRESWTDLLRTLRSLDLEENVAPVQLALRLLVPAGSRLLELEDIRAVLDGYDPEALVWRWRHADPDVDALASQALHVVDEGMKAGISRAEVFAQLADLAQLPPETPRTARAAIPYLEEPWFC